MGSLKFVRGLRFDPGLGPFFLLLFPSSFLLHSGRVLWLMYFFGAQKLGKVVCVVCRSSFSKYAKRETQPPALFQPFYLFVYVLLFLIDLIASIHNYLHSEKASVSGGSELLGEDTFV